MTNEKVCNETAVTASRFGLTLGEAHAAICAARMGATSAWPYGAKVTAAIAALAA